MTAPDREYIATPGMVMMMTEYSVILLTGSVLQNKSHGSWNMPLNYFTNLFKEQPLTPPKETAGKLFKKKFPEDSPKEDHPLSCTDDIVGSGKLNVGSKMATVGARKSPIELKHTSEILVNFKGSLRN